MFEVVLIFLVAWPKLEKSHGARTRASKMNARGVGHGTKIKKKASKTCSKTDAKNDATNCRIWRQNQAKMEPKWHPKINVFLARFLEASGNIDGASAERRGSVEGALRERRGSHFLQPTPQGGPILSKNIVE